MVSFRQSYVTLEPIGWQRSILHPAERKKGLMLRMGTFMGDSPQDESRIAGRLPITTTTPLPCT
jgi:hypothetical protein